MATVGRYTREFRSWDISLDNISLRSAALNSASSRSLRSHSRDTKETSKKIIDEVRGRGLSKISRRFFFATTSCVGRNFNLVTLMGGAGENRNEAHVLAELPFF